MKRSEINALMRDTAAFFRDHRFRLPPWAYWGPERWAQEPETRRFVRDRQMGWDITDYGGGDFARRGLILFCLRNGKQSDPDTVPYAEKIMVIREGQECPFHFHKVKLEDIIVRGGGDLVLELFHTTPNGTLNRTAPVTVRTDGIPRTLAPGEPVTVHAGESITLDRGVSHRFYGKVGTGKVLVGEVSQVNDDFADNFFDEPVGRFAEIDEDVPILWPLWSELPDD